jgi:hypothetical protein
VSACLTWFVCQRAPAIIDARRRRLAIIENFYSEIDRPEAADSAADLPVGADGALVVRRPIVRLVVVVPRRAVVVRRRVY